jgi:hypothetical protein
VAVHADDLTVGELLRKSRDGVTLVDKCVHVGPFRADVVELEHQRVGKLTVGATCGREDARDELSSPFLPPPLRRGTLRPMKLTPLLEVLAQALSAATLCRA